MIQILLALLIQSAPPTKCGPPSEKCGPPERFQLTVPNGKGSGVYVCGEKVKIEAAGSWQTYGIGDDGVTHESHALIFDAWHAGWDGDTSFDDGRRKRKATIVMPCRDATVEARYTPKPPKRKP